MLNSIQLTKQGIALYHCVYKNEDFDKAANDLFQLMEYAQETFPDKKRALYLDIEGHKNENGSFDLDMFELQTEFMMKEIMPYISELHQPLSHLKNDNQKNFIFRELKILKEEN